MRIRDSARDILAEGSRNKQMLPNDDFIQRRIYLALDSTITHAPLIKLKVDTLYLQHYNDLPAQNIHLITQSLRLNIMTSDCARTFGWRPVTYSSLPKFGHAVSGSR